MWAPSIAILAFAAAGFAQVPEGYRTVYISTMVDSKYVIVPKASKAGGTVVVYASCRPVLNLADLAGKRAPTSPSSSGTSRPAHPRSSSPTRRSAWTRVPRVSAVTACNKTISVLTIAANWKDMGTLYLQTCSDTADAQKWTVMADGRIALTASSPRKSCFIIVARMLTCLRGVCRLAVHAGDGQQPRRAVQLCWTR